MAAVLLPQASVHVKCRSTKSLYISMKEIVCAKIRIRSGYLDRVRSWAHEISSRRDEALMTLAAEGVTIESVFLDSGPEGDFLVYYMRTTSLVAAQKAASESIAPIDAFHRDFKCEVWMEVRRLELLVDLTRIDVQQISAT